MKKINQFMLGVFLLSSISFANAAEKTNTTSVEKPASNISYEITNIQQYAHSDGYVVKQKNGVEEKVFAGTNHYKADMIVTNNGKKVSINIMYSITDPKATGSQETEKSPDRIVIGEEIFNEDSIIENQKFKRSPNKELDKLQSIGISKQEFDREMHLHFKNVLYL